MQEYVRHTLLRIRTSPVSCRPLAVDLAVGRSARHRDLTFDHFLPSSNPHPSSTYPAVTPLPPPRHPRSISATPFTPTRTTAPPATRDLDSPILTHRPPRVAQSPTRLLDPRPLVHTPTLPSELRPLLRSSPGSVCSGWRNLDCSHYCTNPETFSPPLTSVGCPLRATTNHVRTITTT